MITPADIIKKAERKYNDLLRSVITGEQHDLFPLDFPAGRAAKDLHERRNEIEALQSASKETKNVGYEITYKTINQRDLGRQTVPDRVVIATQEDYLTLIRKKTEFAHFRDDVERIRQQQPKLETWMPEHAGDIIAHHGVWDDLLTVCSYFLKNSRPSVYVRELPINVHTKFIEHHEKILRSLLDHLLPAATVQAEEKSFAARYGLRDKPSLVRARLLDEQLEWQFGLRLDDLTLPVEQLDHLLAAHLKPKHIIIVENLINFLTLPQHAETVALLGAGFRVSFLGSLRWLRECDVLYWGDLDAYGLQILSNLRMSFPHTRTVLMDQTTLDRYVHLLLEGKTPSATDTTGLTASEAALLRRLQNDNLRLEQEHIPHADSVAAIRAALHSNPSNTTPSAPSSSTQS